MGNPMNEPAETLGLSRHVLFRLQRHRIVASGEYGAATVGEVLAMYRSGEVDHVPGLGRTRLKELRDALERAGLEVDQEA